MARRTFFSFHYERDIWRASIVRKSSALQPSVDAEWIDASIWEDEKKKGDAAVKKLIDNALYGTSVTAVLIGARTSQRKFVKYEIDKSIERGKGLFGIYIHNIEDSSGSRDNKGSNPLPAGYKTYDWVNDKGYDNLGTWVEAAYQAGH